MQSTLQTYESCLTESAQQREEVVVLTAENRAAIRTIAGSLGPRFIDFGICEQTMIGAAAGLALRGRIPVVHALATFLTMRAFEFIRTDIGIPRLPVKLVGAVPGFLSEANGPTHQALEDISLMRSIPGMHIFCPADVAELCDALPFIIDHPAPWYIRFCADTPAQAHTEVFVPGRAEQFGNGTEVAILTYGMLLRQALEARDRLLDQGVTTSVINLRTLAPIDRRAIMDAACQTSQLVTLEDHFITGGLRSIVAEVLLDAGFTVPVHSLSLRNQWFTPGLLPEVLENEGFTGELIAEQILHVLSLKRQWQTD